MSFTSQLADIDSCHTLFLYSIGERDQNTLSIIVDEAITSPVAQGLTVGGRTIDNVHAVEVTPLSRTFELYWDNYISIELKAAIVYGSSWQQ